FSLFAPTTYVLEIHKILIGRVPTELHVQHLVSGKLHSLRGLAQQSHNVTLLPRVGMAPARYGNTLALVTDLKHECLHAVEPQVVRGPPRQEGSQPAQHQSAFPAVRLLYSSRYRAYHAALAAS